MKIGEIRELNVGFDENKRLKLYENLFDFIKYGLLGGLECNK